jgi:hypothetical protein
MVYDGYKVYGPYTRKDKRQHVCLVGSDGHRKTVSYPKFLVEIRIGRLLEEDDTVDHVNGDFSDNSPENLRVLKRGEHVALDVKRRVLADVMCPMCGISFQPSRPQLRPEKAGPFCSRVCAGKYGAEVQNGMPRLKKTHVATSYISRKEHQGGKPLE